MSFMQKRSPRFQNPLADPPAGGGGSDTSLSPAAASLVLAGATALLALGLTASSAAAALSGGTPSLLIGTSIAPSGTTLTLSPSTPSLIISSVRAPAAATLTLTPATPLLGLGLSPSAASLALAGGTPQVLVGVAAQPSGASLVLSASTPLQDLGLRPSAASLALAGSTPQLFVGATVQPSAGSLVLSAATPKQDLGIRPAIGSLALSPGTPSVFVGATVQPSAASLSLSASTPLFDQKLPATSTSLSLAAGTPTLVISSVRAPAGATLALSAATPTRVDLGLLPSGAVLALSPAAPNMAGTSQFSTAKGALTLSGGTPALVVSAVRSAASASFALSGGTPTLKVAVVFSPLKAALALFGGTPSLNVAGGPKVITFTSESVRTPSISPVLVTSVSPYAARVIADGAINYWRRLSGTSLVDVIAGNNGTATGPVTSVSPGVLSDGDPGVTFDNSSSRAAISVPANAARAALTVFTQELWVRLGAGPGDVFTEAIAVGWADTALPTSDAIAIAAFWNPPVPEVIAVGFWQIVGDFYVNVEGNTVFLSTANDDQTAPVTLIPADTDLHLVMTYDGTQGVLYVNGIAAESVAAAGILAHAGLDGSLVIGNTHGDLVDGANGWNGLVDEIAVYPVALTADQVAAHYALRVASLRTGGIRTPMFVDEQVVS